MKVQNISASFAPSLPTAEYKLSDMVICLLPFLYLPSRIRLEDSLSSDKAADVFSHCSPGTINSGCSTRIVLPALKFLRANNPLPPRGDVRTSTSILRFRHCGPNRNCRRFENANRTKTLGEISELFSHTIQCARTRYVPHIISASAFKK